METWMKYTVGDEVRYVRTGQYGIVTQVNTRSQTYVVEINDNEYSVSEAELD